MQNTRANLKRFKASRVISSVSHGRIALEQAGDALTDARQLAMYVARKCTTLSLPTIAASFNRTHAAVIVGVKQCEKRLCRESWAMRKSIMKEFGYDINDVMA